MISSLCWIPKNAARRDPLRFELSKEEYDELKRKSSGTEALKGDGPDPSSMDDGFEDANSDDSSDDEEEQIEGQISMDGILEGNDMVDDDEAFDMMEYGDSALAMNVDGDDEDEEDHDNNRIKPTDALFCVALSDEEYSHLEVQLYDTKTGNLFVHHDIIMPDMPLCTAWLDIPPFTNDKGGQTDCGNYLAVGTMSPGIEIWNLDVMDALEPSAVLGGISTTADKKTKKTKGKGKKGKGKGKKGGGGGAMCLRPGSHMDAVMALSWNRSYRQAVASGSADNSVKVWDVTTQACLHTFSHHDDKVQCVEWHATEAWMLATGSFDKRVCVVDCRGAGAQSASTMITADIEDMVWDPFNSNVLLCSSEDGMVCAMDVRQMGEPLYSFKAHDGSCSSITFSHLVPSMLATAGYDKTVKIWDTASAPEPKAVAYKSMGVGQLFTVAFYPNAPFMLAAGGDGAIVGLWETDADATIEAHFAGRVREQENENADEATSGDEEEGEQDA